MKATINVDIEPDHAKIMLRISGFNVSGKTDKELCEMAIKMNDCYGVKTESIIWEDGQKGKE